MKKRILGQTLTGDSLEIDLPRLIETRLLIQANSGGGKSWAIRRLLEETCKDVQQLVIDCEGEFSTLRERHDYVICAPQGGDVVAEPRTAALLARRLLELRASAIVDIYDLKNYDRHAFVRLFIDSLVNAPKKDWHPVLVVIDEAHVFCPESGKSESASAVIDLATRGRKRGFCAVLATQRLSKLHKDAAAEMANKMIGRTGLDIDVRRAADELGLSSRDSMRALSLLHSGEFFVYGPALSRDVQKIKVGEVKTTHPKVGQRLVAPPPIASEKIKSILAELSDLPKEAEREATTVLDLKRENAELKRALAAKPKELPPLQPQVIKVSIVPVEDMERLKKSRETISRAATSIADAIAILEDGAREFDKLKNETPSNRIPIQLSLPDEEGFDSALPTYKKGLKPFTLRPSPQKDSSTLTGPERRILTPLVQHSGPMDAVRLALYAGYSYTGGAFRNPLSSLRTKGFVSPGNPVSITEEGQEALGLWLPLPVGKELVEYWARRLTGPERKIFMTVIDAAPNPIDKDECARRAGYEPTGGAFRNPLSRLRTLELISGSANLIAHPVFYEG